MKASSFLSLLFFILITFLAKAQQGSDTILVKKGFITSYLYKGNLLDHNDLGGLLNSNNASAYHFKKWKQNELLGNVFGLPGSFLVGYYLGARIGGKDGNPTLLGVGLGMVAIGFGFDAIGSGHLKKGIRLFNNQARQTSFLNQKTELKFCLGLGSFGFKMTF